MCTARAPAARWACRRAAVNGACGAGGLLRRLVPATKERPALPGLTGAKRARAAHGQPSRRRRACGTTAVRFVTGPRRTAVRRGGAIKCIAQPWEAHARGRGLPSVPATPERGARPVNSRLQAARAAHGRPTGRALRHRPAPNGCTVGRCHKVYRSTVGSARPRPWAALCSCHAGAKHLPGLTGAKRPRAAHGRPSRRRRAFGTTAVRYG